MRDTPPHIANARVKAISGILFNLGAVLLAAAGAQVYADGGVGLGAASWTVEAAILIFVGWSLLTLLQIEDAT